MSKHKQHASAEYDVTSKLGMTITKKIKTHHTRKQQHRLLKQITCADSVDESVLKILKKSKKTKNKYKLLASAIICL